MFDKHLSSMLIPPMCKALLERAKRNKHIKETAIAGGMLRDSFYLGMDAWTYRRGARKSYHIKDIDVFIYIPEKIAKVTLGHIAQEMLGAMGMPIYSNAYYIKEYEQLQSRFGDDFTWGVWNGCVQEQGEWKIGVQFIFLKYPINERIKAFDFGVNKIWYSLDKGIQFNEHFYADFLRQNLSLTSGIKVDSNIIDRFNRISSKIGFTDRMIFDAKYNLVKGHYKKVYPVAPDKIALYLSDEQRAKCRDLLEPQHPPEPDAIGNGGGRNVPPGNPVPNQVWAQVFADEVPPLNAGRTVPTRLGIRWTVGHTIIPDPIPMPDPNYGVQADIAALQQQALQNYAQAGLIRRGELVDMPALERAYNRLMGNGNPNN